MLDPFEQRLELAKKLSQERRYADAIVMFDWLCDDYPDRAAALIGSANVFSRLYDYAAVRLRFARLEACTNVPAEVWTAMANTSSRLNRPQWAESYFANAVSKAVPSADAFGAFASYLEHSNDLDRAGEFADRGLRLDSSNPSCQLAKAKVLRRQKSLDGADAKLRELLGNPAAPIQTRISALHELAQLSDAKDDCAGAISALIKAKQLAASQPEYRGCFQRAAVAERLEYQFLTTVNPEYFKRASEWVPSAPRRFALLAGHPRSGTTLLEQILDSHTGIISAQETLVHHISVNVELVRELDDPNACEATLRIPAARLERWRSAYFRTMESVLDQPLAGRLLVDKNPSCTTHIPVFARVFPECSYIIALRDPRDVVLSCYFQDLPLNESSIRFQSLKDTAMRYAHTMNMWRVCRQFMDQRKWIEVRYESLAGDLFGEAQRVMKKLSLDVQPAQLQPDARARSKMVESPTYADVFQPVHSRAIGKWKRYEPWLGEIMPILQPLIEAFKY